MPAVDDILEFQVIHEQEGVQGTWTFWHKLLDVGNSPAILDAVDDWITRMVLIFANRMSIKWAVTCVIYRNLTDLTEGEIPIIKTLPGANAIDEPHPSMSVAWMTRYARRQDTGKNITGGFSINGHTVIEDEVGRLENTIEWASLENFVKTTDVFPALGWQLEPHQQYTHAVGPPKVLEYSPILQAIFKPRLTTLRSRQSRLCRA